jgi:hypothetical protein
MRRDSDYRSELTFDVRLMPTMNLGSPCCFLCGTDNALLAVTTSGMLYSWSVQVVSP